MKRCFVLATVSACVFSVLGSTANAQGENKPYERLQEAGTLIQNGKYQDAERLLIGLSEEIPKSFTLWYKLALVRQLQGQLKKAIEPIRKALEIQPKDATALLLGAELIATKDKKQAVDWALQAGIAARDDENRLRKIVDLLVRLSEFESALPILKKLQAKRPNDMKLLALQAKIALGGRKLEEAADAYRKMIKLNPRDPIPVESLGNVLALLDKKKEACDVLAGALRIRPSNLAVRARLINLMEQLEYPEKKIAAQKQYLKYYRWVHSQVRKKQKGTRRVEPGAKPPRTGR